MLVLLKYEILNLLRARWLVFYGIFFACFTYAILQFGTEAGKSVASVMNISLLVIPMVSILYSVFYWYEAETFTSLLLTQAIRRSILFLARWLATSFCLGLSYLIGSFTGILTSGALSKATLLLLVFGTLLNFIFVAIGLLIAVAIQDRLKGIGLALVVWLYFSILHDAFFFFFVSFFREYPIEIPGIFLMLLNPVDLTRISLLMCLNFTTMMGYTGRILQKILSSSSGLILTNLSLFFWLTVPIFFAVRYFQKRDL